MTARVVFPIRDLKANLGRADAKRRQQLSLDEMIVGLPRGSVDDRSEEPVAEVGVLVATSRRRDRMIGDGRAHCVLLLKLGVLLAQVEPRQRPWIRDTSRMVEEVSQRDR